jgi:hypothetical protein
MAQTAHDDVLEVGADKHGPPIIGADRGGLILVLNFLILVLNFLLLLMRTMSINSDHPVALSEAMKAAAVAISASVMSRRGVGPFASNSKISTRDLF